MSKPTFEITPVTPKAAGGGLEGAERTTRETFRWTPAIISPDRQINPNKEMADARVRDSMQNDGFVMGAVNTHRDSIVGGQFRLNARPNADVLGADEGWVDEFQKTVESRFNLLADSEENWFDASRKSTLTGLIRMGVIGDLMCGEILGTVEWIRESSRPFKTAIQLISPSRLSNPDNVADDRFLRRGIRVNIYGEALGYHIRASHPTDFYNDMETHRWIYVPARKPWGRRQVIHIIQPMQPDQTRGISDMVTVLKNHRMTKQFREVTLQNAVINASYAAAVESELPREMVFGAMGAGQSGFAEMLGQYMTALDAYQAGSDNIAIDGAKIPHFFPGTKLNLKPMGTPGGIGTDFEESLLRHTAAGLGLSYEQFAHDYTKTNYSSARASMGETHKHMQARKRATADRLASNIYALWFEEEINAGNVPLPSGKKADIFYDPVMREALLKCAWIGAARGQIDEKKETDSAVARIQNNLSTLEIECARLGEDYRDILRQRMREEKMKTTYNLSSTTSDQQQSKKGDNSGDNTESDESDSQGDN
jgi:lambda family phage portal protein